MTNQEQRTKIEKLLNEIEESATDLTAEQQEAMFSFKALTGMLIDFLENLQKGEPDALEELNKDFEVFKHQITALRMQNLPSGGIVGAVVPGELHEGEVVIKKG
jgi:hypothetical protein